MCCVDPLRSPGYTGRSGASMSCIEKEQPGSSPNCLASNLMPQMQCCGNFAGLARLERLTRIALRRFSGLRPACGVQNADAFCRTGVLIVIQDTQNKKGAPMGPLLYLARPERFELPTARFVVSSLYSNVLKYNKVRWGARCMNCPTVHNGAQPKHAKAPQ
jgi:hypothetical protein